MFKWIQFFKVCVWRGGCMARGTAPSPTPWYTLRRGRWSHWSILLTDAAPYSPPSSFLLLATS